jgi:hypothetical protein
VFRVAVDIDEGGADSVKIQGASCVYVLSVVVHGGLEVSVFDNSTTDLTELKEALKTALNDRCQVVLLRADTPPGGVKRWQSLEPEIFVPRLPNE